MTRRESPAQPRRHLQMHRISMRYKMTGSNKRDLTLFEYARRMTRDPQALVVRNYCVSRYHFDSIDSDIKLYASKRFYVTPLSRVPVLI